MTRHANAIALAMLISCCAAALGQDKQAKADTLIGSRVRSVVESLQQRLVERNVCHVPPEALLREVQSSLAAHRKPALQLLQTKQSADFESRFAELIDDLARKLDPNGNFGLAQQVQAIVAKPLPGQKVSLKEQARTEHQRYLAKEFADEYERVRVKVATQQLREITAILAKNDRYAPSVDSIERAADGPVARADVISGIRQSLSSILKGNLLVETEHEVGLLAVALVDSGLDQLRGQMDQLAESPKACTLPGAILEQRARLEQQVKNTKPKKGFKVYPVFPRAEKEAHIRAALHFDERVAKAAGALSSQLADGTMKLDDAHRAAVRQTIEQGIVKHHHHAESIKLLEPVAGDVLAALKSKIVERFEQQAPARTPGDRDEDLKALPEFVRQRLDVKNSAPHAAWEGLEKAARQKFEGMVALVRADIAQQQAKARGKPWRPSEKEILANPPDKLDFARLKGLSLWAGAPPAMTDLLEETHELLLRDAKAALNLGAEALNRQLLTVEREKAHLMPAMKTKADAGTQHWVTEYTKAVIARWQRDGTSAQARYPELFVTSEDKIKAIVSDALSNAAREAQLALVAKLEPAMQQRVVAQRLNGERPIFDPHYAQFEKDFRAAWQRDPLAVRSAEVLDATEVTMRGLVQKTVAAQCQMLDELKKNVGDDLSNREKQIAVGIPPTGTAKDAVRKFLDGVDKEQRLPIEEQKRLDLIDEAGKILIEQTKLVEKCKPGIRADVTAAFLANKEPALDEWAAEFGKRVRVLWNDHPLSKKEKELLPPVLAAIKGVTADLVKAERSRIDELVRQAQLELVGKHEDLIKDEIRKAKAATQAQFVERYSSLVLKDWRKTPLYQEVCPRYAGLHQAATDRIVRIVADELPNAAQAVPSDAPDQNAKHGAGAAPAIPPNDGTGNAGGAAGDGGAQCDKGDGVGAAAVVGDEAGGGGAGGGGGGGAGGGGLGGHGDGVCPLCLRPFGDPLHRGGHSEPPAPPSSDLLERLLVGLVILLLVVIAFLIYKLRSRFAHNREVLRLLYEFEPDRHKQLCWLQELLKRKNAKWPLASFEENGFAMTMRADSVVPDASIQESKQSA